MIQTGLMPRSPQNPQNFAQKTGVFGLNAVIAGLAVSLGVVRPYDPIRVVARGLLYVGHVRRLIEWFDRLSDLV